HGTVHPRRLCQDITDCLRKREHAGELVLSLISIRVGKRRSAKQRLAHNGARSSIHDLARDIVTVQSVVDKSNAEVWLADVHPPVGTHFVAGTVPRGVAVQWPPDVAELSLERSLGGVQIKREGQLEQALPLVPVDHRANLNPCSVWHQTDPLVDRTPADVSTYPDT